MAVVRVFPLSCTRCLREAINRLLQTINLMALGLCIRYTVISDLALLEMKRSRERSEISLRFI
jgi:hypothetical protein